MKKIAIYSRKSIATDTGDSIENQVEKVKKYFSDEDCEFMLFEDEGWSGGNNKRPDFQRMMSKVMNGEIDIVAVYMLDRVSRNVVDFVNFYDTIVKHNVAFISVTEGFDFSTPIGKMYMYLLSIFAEMERENISKRVKDNKLFLTKQGHWTGGAPPSGYNLTREVKDEKKVTYLKLDEDNKHVILEIYDKYLELGSLHKVQKWLLEDKDIKWCLSTIKYILSSPVYCTSDDDSFKYLSSICTVYGKPNGCGYISYDNRKKKNSTSNREWKSKDMFISVSKHEAIIPSEKWIQIQELQKQRAMAPRPKASKVSYFTNILKCDICGSPMTLNYNHTNKDGIRNYYYVCTGKRSYGTSYCKNKWINQNICDEKIIEFLEHISTNKKVFMDTVGIKPKSTVDVDISKVEKEINKINNDLEELTEKMILVKGHALKTVTNKMNSLSDKLTDLKIKLDALERKSFSERNSTKSLDAIFDEIKVIPKILRDPNISIDIKRKLVNISIRETRWNSATESLYTSLDI